jgi:hypothetical protein
MSKLAWAGELMLMGASWNDKDGHMIKMKIVSPNEEKPNPFKAFTKRKGGRAGTRFHASVAHVQGLRGNETCYDGQFMLAGWQDSSTAGYGVTFWCEPPEDGRVHAFDGFTRGVDSFMVALVELSDDDTPVDQEKRERIEKVEEQSEQKAQERKKPLLSTAAAMICQNPAFWRWVHHERGGPVVVNSDQAAQWMREHLGIDSRRDLDTMDAKAEQFHRAIRRPFAEWMEGAAA